MHTSDRPGTNAARHGSGDRLIAMNAAHAAFRRDLERMAAAATPANLCDPARRASILNGWTMFKGQLHIHHDAEDRILWPRLRQRLATSQAALSTLDAMDAEHARIDPLLAAVDTAFTAATAGPTAGPGGTDVAAAVEELAASLSDHLSHEEREAMPMVGEALSDREWRAVVAGIHKRVKSLGVLSVADFVPWLTDGVAAPQAKKITTIVPPPVRLLHRWVWKPRYDAVSRW
jgi:iron-sulfur cluster repair protein YtfE (RIC family)